MLLVSHFLYIYIKHIMPKSQRLQNKTGMCNATVFHNDKLCYLKITCGFEPTRFCRMKYHRLQLIDWWKSVEIWLVYKVCMHTVITHVYQSFGLLGSPYWPSYLLMQPNSLNVNFRQLRRTCCFHFDIKDGGDEIRLFYKRICFTISTSS